MDDARERSPRRTRECPICLDSLPRPGETTDFESPIITLKECNRTFHSSCAALWFRRNRTCPICRSLPTDNGEHEEHSDSEVEVTAQEMATMTARELTLLVAEPLRAARRRDAAPAMRSSATAFRRDRDSAIAAARAPRRQRNSEPLRTLMQELRTMVDDEATRRQTAAAWAGSLLEIWGTLHHERSTNWAQL
jgi:hypothetical protein